MNFITSSTALLRHLQSISGVLSTSNTLPILDNFLFEIADNQLTISASDLETTMRTTMEVEANGEGKIAIPAKLLLDVLKNLPDQPCTFSIDYPTFAIEIAYDNGKSKMVGFNGDEFPKIPVIENSSSVRVSGEIISSAINKTLFATGNDDLRPVMSGVFCQFSPQDIIFVATDAHKLVRYRRTDSSAETTSSFILPKKPLNLLRSNVTSDIEVLIEYNESNAVFSFGDIVLVCRLIDGKYPNYEAVIPKENPNVLIIDRTQFLGSIKRVSIFANKTTHQIKLKLAGSELALSAEDLDFSNEANERLTCNYDGEDMEIAFNSRFLLEMLNNIDTKEVKLEMSVPSRAGLLMPAESTNQDEDILMLVMPVMLNK
ncbi:DNA polymerase III subunit beta [Crocinitomicaceae bacterium CZZ-1]|uniref:Beta sliding clamp n=1 Tax=Taishania pollutisoli TaxID=2766479 RepID=A0A8J6P7N7_9FLAO|nr:DNA polymerase III subunit beta [Taishania pollutisoli]MBC9813579.1 DNA polymerase III subunit beta [Taishania pollutisoli]MBX2949087.1 DNA polymerase III subunit beta [Crocinitomicaceae bacterium]NGF75983.1 DNA polymerase III subunit beta [Fluviicola sp. SGL-29]